MAFDVVRLRLDGSHVYVGLAEAVVVAVSVHLLLFQQLTFDLIIIIFPLHVLNYMHLLCVLLGFFILLFGTVVVRLLAVVPGLGCALIEMSVVVQGWGRWVERLGLAFVLLHVQ